MHDSLKYHGCYNHQTIKFHEARVKRYWYKRWHVGVGWEYEINDASIDTGHYYISLMEQTEQGIALIR